MNEKEIKELLDALVVVDKAFNQAQEIIDSIGIRGVSLARLTLYLKAVEWVQEVGLDLTEAQRSAADLGGRIQ